MPDPMPSPQADGDSRPPSSRRLVMLRQTPGDPYQHALDKLAEALIRVQLVRQGLPMDTPIPVTLFERARYDVAPFAASLMDLDAADKARAEAIRDLEDAHEIDPVGREGMIARFAIDDFQQRLIERGRRA